MVIRNFDTLATSQPRKIVLELLNAALSAIHPDVVIPSSIKRDGSMLKIDDTLLSLEDFSNVYLIGYGKGSAYIAKVIADILQEKLTQGYVIDVTSEEHPKIAFTQGTHPFPSETNLAFTQKMVDLAKDFGEKDLAIVVTAGGGSSLFELPYHMDLEHELKLDEMLLKSGADIYEMNTVRKHISKVKGGGFAQILYPAKVVNLVFSDVPGNDVSVIASGPLVKDETTKEDAQAVLEKYQLTSYITKEDITETPKDDIYFESVDTILVLSNQTALEAMQKKASDLGIESFVLTDRLKGDALQLGKELIEKSQAGKILLAAGESTIKVTGKGKGGRNQSLVLAAFPFILENTVLASCDSDGWDFTTFAGAVADWQSVQKAATLGLDREAYLADNNATPFFEQLGDGIDTGKLPSNVSDIMIVYSAP